MLIVERQERVLEILKQRKAAQLEDLAGAVEVSSSTIRRDLEALESRGLVQRTHGGAIYRGDRPLSSFSSFASQPAITARLGENVPAKEAIGRCAASLVQPQMTLLLDGGSTVVIAARHIIARPIQVVTNSLLIANFFAEDEQVELLLVGGNLYPRTGVTVGPIATGCLADFHADLCFMSLAGIYGQEGFNINLAMAQVEQAMIRQAARSVLLMDSTKFGRKSLVRVCNVSEADQIITDPQIDPAWSQTLGDRLVIAGG